MTGQHRHNKKLRLWFGVEDSLDESLMGQWARCDRKTEGFEKKVGEVGRQLLNTVSKSEASPRVTRRKLYGGRSRGQLSVREP